MKPWNKADVSEAKFRAVWAFHDGAPGRIGKHLHMGWSAVVARGRALGLRRSGYLTTGDAAPILGISRREVTWWCQQGELPAVRNRGKRTVFKITRSAVLEFKGRLPMLNIRHLLVEEGYVSGHDLAERLGFSMNSVRALCWDGTITATKTAKGDWRIPEAEAARIVAEVRAQGYVTHRPQPKPIAPKVKEMLMFPKDVAGLLRFYVERSGHSVNSIALTAGMNPAHLSRAMRGERDLSRTKIDAVAGALRLTGVDHGRLLVAGGFAPRSFLTLGYDDTFDVVAGVLADPSLDESERAAYREQIVNLTAQYRRRRAGLMGVGG